jgi:hypothetical protein
VGSRGEQFEQIRRDREREDLSLRALAERHGVHRRTVRAALESPLPPAKRRPVSRPAPKLGAYRELIDAWLIADLEAPRKQRHTSKRIWRRLVDEHGVGLTPVDLRRDRGRVDLRHEHIAHAVAELAATLAHVIANRRLRDLGLASGYPKRWTSHRRWEASEPSGAQTEMARSTANCTSTRPPTKRPGDRPRKKPLPSSTPRRSQRWR